MLLQSWTVWLWAFEKWRTYLDCHLFSVVTNHASLLWVFKTTKPNNRLIRWALRLQEFTFTVEYRKAKYNTEPDALSRAPAGDQPTLPVCATIMTASSRPSKDLPMSIEAMWKTQQEEVVNPEKLSSIQIPHSAYWRTSSTMLSHSHIGPYTNLHTCQFQDPTSGEFQSRAPLWSSWKAQNLPEIATPGLLAKADLGCPTACSGLPSVSDI